MDNVEFCKYILSAITDFISRYFDVIVYKSFERLLYSRHKKTDMIVGEFETKSLCGYFHFLL